MGEREIDSFTLTANTDCIYNAIMNHGTYSELLDLVEVIGVMTWAKAVPDVALRSTIKFTDVEASLVADLLEKDRAMYVSQLDEPYIDDMIALFRDTISHTVYDDVSKK